MMNLLLRATGIWLVMLLAAILNAALREQLFAPWLGKTAALPLSGITLSALVFGITLVFIPRFGNLRTSLYFTIGLVWVMLTLAFEFLLGHFLLGQSWRETTQVLNLTQGNLFALVLVVSL
ncbi:MAG: hypothetical protein HKM88_05310, partial [Halobacteria archaeon]|nr:hypothetical protein [Halobacteria archaeon]